MSRHIMWRLLAESSLNSLIWLVGFLGLLHTGVLWLCFVWSDNKGVKESICLYFHTEVYFTYKSDRNCSMSIWTLYVWRYFPLQALHLGETISITTVLSRACVPVLEAVWLHTEVPMCMSPKHLNLKVTHTD